MKKTVNRGENIPSGITFKQWQQQFLRGGTTGIYLSLISFAILAVMVLYSRFSLFNFLVNEVALLTSFGVLVDLVSHLFNNRYRPDITLDEWFIRFKGGRTHDAYGIIIQFGCSFFDFRLIALLPLLWIALAGTMFLIVRARFYH